VPQSFGQGVDLVATDAAADDDDWNTGRVLHILED